MNPDALGSRLVSARATQKGDVLILLDKESNKEVFTAEVRRVVVVVVLSEDDAIKLEELSRLKVGMTSCRVRRRVVVTRCFRCLGFGHQRRSSKEEDRSSLCYKYSEAGHPAKNCTGTQKCFLCVKEDPAVDYGHVAGSGACTAFQRALEAEKKKERWKPPKRK